MGWVLDCGLEVNDFEVHLHNYVQFQTNTLEKVMNPLSPQRLIGLVGRVFANGPGDLGSIPGRFIPKTLKMVLDTSLLNTQQYKVHIIGKMEQSRERSSALPLHLGVVAIEKGAFWLPSTEGRQLYLLYCSSKIMVLALNNP